MAHDVEPPFEDFDESDFDEIRWMPGPGARTDLKCGDCGAPMQLKPSKYGQFYGCVRWPECKGTHGAHKDGSPKGVPANLATRRARTAAHDAFDRLWKPASDSQPLMRRKEAYAWLMRRMSLTAERAHIAMFTQEQCEKLVRCVQKEFPGLFNSWARLTSDEDLFDG